MNLIPVKDRIRCVTCCPFLVHFSSGRVGAYGIRPTNAYVNRQMIQSPGTCWGVFDTPLHKQNQYLLNTYSLNPFRVKFSSLDVGAYGIRPPDASAWRRMTPKRGTCLGVFDTPLPIRIKNLIPIYWMNLKPGGFWGACLCGQPHPGEKPLKFVWMHVKPGGDGMKMAISTENPARIG